MTNIYEGCQVTESDLNHSTVNIRTLDWYTDSTVSSKATFPITTTESTTLYSSYLKGNIPEENVKLDYTGLRLVTHGDITGGAYEGNGLYYGATSEVAGYTPITTSDTTLVIPDMFQLSDGRILPIVEASNLNPWTLLEGDTIVKNVYLGNNIAHVGKFANSSSIENLYMGIDMCYIFDLMLGNSITNIYFEDTSVSDWCYYQFGEFKEVVAEATLLDSVAAKNIIKQIVGDIYVMQRFGIY